MKQYKFTSADFVPQDTHIPDAFMEDSELTRIRQLAGVSKPNLLKEYTAGGSNPDHNTVNFNDTPTPSAVGSIGPSKNAEKRNIERDLNIKTGTPEWFRLWFARPELTGEKPVGDDLPESEPNPSYLLTKDGQADKEKLSDMADKLENNQQN